jgi:hypothetical protein
MTEPEGVPKFVDDPCIVATCKNLLPIEVNVRGKPAHPQ